MSYAIEAPRQTFDQGLGWRDLAVTLLHQVGDIHIQLLSEIGERPELLGASFTDARGERIWFIRHLLTQRGVLNKQATYFTIMLLEMQPGSVALCRGAI
jgi:hypothetical protein